MNIEIFLLELRIVDFFVIGDHKCIYVKSFKKNIHILFKY